MKSKYVRNIVGELLARFTYDGTSVDGKTITKYQLINKINKAAKTIRDKGLLDNTTPPSPDTEWLLFTKEQKLKIVGDYLSKVIDNLSKGEI